MRAAALSTPCPLSPTAAPPPPPLYSLAEAAEDTAGAMAVAGTLTTLTLPLRLGVLPFVVDWVLSRGGNSASEGTVRRAS